ncbi:hypothetical protein SAMN02910456_02719 [Ruminococcaceae bacterium YRB3002]|nr:hypothetical protein SAMN02910456_02719 [Ruminococcaceae bacterium YRB3002]
MIRKYLSSDYTNQQFDVWIKAKNNTGKAVTITLKWSPDNVSSV